jgi:hypothetical protein
VGPFPQRAGSQLKAGFRSRIVRAVAASSAVAASAMLAAVSPSGGTRPAVLQSAPEPAVVKAHKVVPAAVPQHAPAPAHHNVTPQAARPITPAHVFTAAAPVQSGYGCGAALAYLSTHAAPGFRFECPAYSLGHQAMTCINMAGVCSGERLITITNPCRAAYMNEASNSWVLLGLRSAPIDPYGYCS